MGPPLKSAKMPLRMAQNPLLCGRAKMDRQDEKGKELLRASRQAR